MNKLPVIASYKNGATNNTDGFTTAHNNRHHKSYRESDSPEHHDHDYDDNSRPNPINKHVTRIIGRSTGMHDQIKAAPRKLVFCVSNVTFGSDSDAFKIFLQDEMNIHVLLIFPAKSINITSATFRVCIPNVDIDKLQDSSTLPAGIVVREWFFKSASSAAETYIHSSHPDEADKRRDRVAV